MEIIDLSLPIDDEAFEMHPVKITRWEHKWGGDNFGKIWAKKQGLKARLRHLLGKKRIDHRSFKDEAFLSLERVSATVHTGTHLDSPYHYGPHCEGKQSPWIDEIPLEWCYGNGVVIDVSHKKPGEFITEDDIKEALKKIDYELKPYDIVLIRTGADKLWGTPKYHGQYPGMSREAVAYIVGCGVKVLGIDTTGLDRPTQFMVKDYLATQDNSYLWPAHFYGREKAYWHMERLANLDKIPQPHGFKVICFPVRIKNTGAAWVRAVAVIE